MRGGYQLAGIDKYLMKPWTIATNLDDRDLLAQIEAVDAFMGRMHAYPGRTFGQLYHRFFRTNDLAQGQPGADRADDRPGRRTVPLLAVAGLGDGIAPVAACHHLAELVPNARSLELETAPAGTSACSPAAPPAGRPGRLLDRFLDRRRRLAGGEIRPAATLSPMRRLLLASLAFASLAPAAHAQAPEPVIRAGVTVAGVDVSNQTLTQAAGTIDRAFRHQLVTRNVSVRVGGKRVQAAHEEGRVRSSIRRSPPAARSSPATTRRRRRSTCCRGRATTRRSSPRSSPAWTAAPASPPATRPCASRSATSSSAPSKSGREMDEKALSEQSRSRSPTRARRASPPEARGDQGRRCARGTSRSRYGTVVTIGRSQFRLRLFKRLKFSKSYGVAVGQPAYPTPTGLFSISNKAVNPTWTAPNRPWAGAYRNETVAGGSAENPLKARWMGIVNGVGIHGTGEPGSIGTAASHGCIRMTVPDVVDLYPRVPVGTPVLIR